MWKLTIEDDEGQQRQMSLSQDEYGVGRAESNLIRLDDRNVSRNHAAFKKVGAGWVLHDLSSYNGTYVNGSRVLNEQPIQSGDIVQLGDYRLELLDEVLVAAVPAQAPAHPPVHQRPNRLVVVVGPQPGMEFPLDKEHFTIGRSEDATISINHSSVSRVHAELFALGNGRFEIVDKQSANGIRINGVELRRGILEAGDALELGDVRLRFVGAGKIFRADMTQALPAVVALDSSSIQSLARSRVGKALGIGVALVVVAIVALVAVSASGGSASTGGKTANSHQVTPQSEKQLKEATKLLDGKDYDGAHKMLLSIPEDDRPTDDADFKRVETAWVDYRLTGMNDAADTTAKRALLKDINQGTLDAKQRARVADMLNELNAKEPPPPADTAGHDRAGYVPNSGATATPTAEPTTTVVSAPPQGAAPELNSEAALRKKLEPSVWSGRAADGEVKMLRAYCRHMHDQVCVARATAILKKRGVE